MQLSKEEYEKWKKKESIMVVWWELKIPSLRITVRHHSASLTMPNSYSRDRIFSPHLTAIKDSYILQHLIWINTVCLGPI